jgi:hypothetical protein
LDRTSTLDPIVVDHGHEVGTPVLGGAIHGDPVFVDPNRDRVSQERRHPWFAIGTSVAPFMRSILKFSPFQLLVQFDATQAAAIILLPSRSVLPTVNVRSPAPYEYLGSALTTAILRNGERLYRTTVVSWLQYPPVKASKLISSRSGASGRAEVYTSRR